MKFNPQFIPYQHALLFADLILEVESTLSKKQVQDAQSIVPPFLHLLKPINLDGGKVDEDMDEDARWVLVKKSISFFSVCSDITNPSESLPLPSSSNANAIASMVMKMMAEKGVLAAEPKAAVDEPAAPGDGDGDGKAGGSHGDLADPSISAQPSVALKSLKSQKSMGRNIHSDAGVSQTMERILGELAKELAAVKRSVADVKQTVGALTRHHNITEHLSAVPDDDEVEDTPFKTAVSIALASAPSRRLPTENKNPSLHRKSTFMPERSRNVSNANSMASRTTFGDVGSSSTNTNVSRRSMASTSIRKGAAIGAQRSLSRPVSIQRNMAGGQRPTSATRVTRPSSPTEQPALSRRPSIVEPELRAPSRRPSKSGNDEHTSYVRFKSMGSEPDAKQAVDLPGIPDEAGGSVERRVSDSGAAAAESLTGILERLTTKPSPAPHD